MDAHDLALVHGGDPERVAVAQVLFLGEGQCEKVLLGENLRDASLLKAPAKVVARRHEALDLLVHALELGLVDLHPGLLCQLGTCFVRADKTGQVLGRMPTPAHVPPSSAPSLRNLSRFVCTEKHVPN